MYRNRCWIKSAQTTACYFLSTLPVKIALQSVRGQAVTDSSHCSTTLMSETCQRLQFVLLHKVDFCCARTGPEYTKKILFKMLLRSCGSQIITKHWPLLPNPLGCPENSFPTASGPGMSWGPSALDPPISPLPPTHSHTQQQMPRCLCSPESFYINTGYEVLTVHLNPSRYTLRTVKLGLC